MLTAIEGRATVQRDDGGVAIWNGDPGDQQGVWLYEAAALAAAADILRLLSASETEERILGDVEDIAILPPPGPGLPGKLTITAGGAGHTMTIDWASLVSLSELAATALMTARSGGGMG